MNSDVAIFLIHKQNMISENDSHKFIKFQNSINTPYQKSSERIKFLQVVNDYLVIINSKIMIRSKQIPEIVQSQLSTIFRRLDVDLIYFFYNLICNHCNNCRFIPSIPKTSQNKGWFTALTYFRPLSIILALINIVEQNLNEEIIRPLRILYHPRIIYKRSREYHWFQEFEDSRLQQKAT